jgi:hypothetical protein
MHDGKGKPPHGGEPALACMRGPWPLAVRGRRYLGHAPTWRTWSCVDATGLASSTKAIQYSQTTVAVKVSTTKPQTGPWTVCYPEACMHANPGRQNTGLQP